MSTRDGVAALTAFLKAKIKASEGQSAAAARRGLDERRRADDGVLLSLLEQLRR